MWIAQASRRHNQGSIAALGGQPNQIESKAQSAEFTFGLRAHPCIATAGDDTRPVARKDRVGVKRWCLSELLRRSPAVGPGFVDMAHAGGEPRHVGKPLPVGRPRGLVFAGDNAVIPGHYATRLAIGQIHHVKMGHRRKRNALAIRRLHRIVDQSRAHRAFFHAALVTVEVAQFLLHFRGKRNFSFRAGGYVDAVNLSAVGHYDFLPGGQKRIAGIEVTAAARFHVVALHGIFHPAILAGFQVADAQAGLRFVTRAVHQPLAVGRNDRAESAIGLGDHVDLAGLHVATGNLPAEIHLVVAAAAVGRALREIHVAAIRGHCRADAWGLLSRATRTSRTWRGGCATDHVDAAAALDVVHPETIAGLLFVHHDVLAVRHPCGRNKADALVLGELFRLGAVHFAVPEVVVAIAVADEGNPFAVGRNAGLGIERERVAILVRAVADRESFGFAAFDGQRVEIAHQLENNRLPVRGDIER